MKIMMLAEFGHGFIKIALTGAGRLFGSDNGIIRDAEVFAAPVYEGEITDWDAAARVFVEYMRIRGVTGCDVKIVLHHPRAAMRFGMFPKMKPIELGKALKYRMAEMFPEIKDEFVYSYRTYAMDNGMTGVIAIRMPLKTSRSYASFFNLLGIKPLLLDTYANTVSMFLERSGKNSFAAIYEHSESISIIGYSGGMPVSSRDIFFSDQAHAIHETQKYLRTFSGLENIFLLTGRGIINDADISGLNKSIASITRIDEFSAFSGLMRRT